MITKKVTEKENLLINELLIHRLKSLYNSDITSFHQLHDLLNLPVYINHRRTLNYSYFNKATLSLGEEVSFLNATRKHSDLKSIANPILFENSKQIALNFNKKNDEYAVCKIIQEMYFNDKMTFFISEKAILNSEESLNLISFPSQYGTIGSIVQEIIPNYAKDITTWQRFQSLTKQEKIILKKLISGLSFKEISEQLHLSYHTVNTHKKNIHKKLDVSNLSDLVRVSIALDFFNFSL